MVAQALRFVQFGWNAANLAPRPSSNPAVNGANLTIPFTGPALVTGALTLAQWSATVNGANAPLTSATVTNGALVTVVLTTPVTNGQAVRVRYAGGGAAPLKEVGGNITPAFNLPVNNVTP